MKNPKLMAVFALPADDDEPDTATPAAPAAVSSWITRYPNTTRMLPDILARVFSDLFSPKDEGGRPTLVPHSIIDAHGSAYEPLTLMYNYCNEEGEATDSTVQIIRHFLVSLSSLNVEGVTVSLQEAHGTVSFESPETIRQFMHALCAQSLWVFDDSSSFRLRPDGVRPVEYARTSHAKQVAAAAALSLKYGEDGQKFVEHGYMQEAVDAMPIRPYVSLRDALGAAACVVQRRQQGHLALSLDGVDACVAADYRQPLPSPYSYTH